MNPTLQDALFFIAKFLNKNRIPYALIGGIAFSYWVENRYTKDVDLTISITEEGWSTLAANLKKYPAVRWKMEQKPQGEEVPDLVRFTWHGYFIDLQMSKTDYQQELIKRRKRRFYLGQPIYFVSPEDLFILKLLAYRPRDYADLIGILESIPKLDFDYIKKWCHVWELDQRLEELLSKS